MGVARGAAPGPAGGEDPEAVGSAPRRKRSRRKAASGRAAPKTRASEDAEPEPAARKKPEADDEEAPRRRPPRGSRGGRRRSKKKATAPVEVEAIPWEDDVLEDPAPAEEEPAAAEKPAGRTRQRKKKTAARSSEERARPEKAQTAKKVTKTTAGAAAAVPNLILVNASERDETRVAVVEQGQIVDFQMTVHRHKSLVNDIYRGRVVNLEPAIGAAFVDFGQGRNGFLHTSDVLSIYGDKGWTLQGLLKARIDPEEWDGESSQPDVSLDLDDSEETSPPKGTRKASKKVHRKPGGRRRARPRLPITDLLKKGQSVVVQITKDAIGDKGPTLTTYISIPGRYLVLMPSMARTGVSRKIEDERERRRLKRILKGMEIPEGMGVIVRTAGVGQTKKDIQRDLDYLLLMWDDFGRRLSLGRGPIPLYEESDVGLRTMRDLFTPATEKVLVDDQGVYDRMVEFTHKLMPDHVERIELHDGQRPLFNAHGIEQDFERIFTRRIELPSGGSIVFDQTEALVAIDVNSGKTRGDGFDFEEVALKTNLEAVPEIARQIRLRDLGGIIVNDYIDMMRMQNRRTVERAFRDALAGDRARSKIGRISQFGLLEMTRQRLGAGLGRMLFATCPRCRGTSLVRTVESRSIAILRRLGSALTLKGFTKVEIRAHPEVIEHLRRGCAPELQRLEKLHDRELIYTAVGDQVEDSVFRYLRADGREVRPGGRRKR